jgi:hypothetical protein
MPLVSPRPSEGTQHDPTLRQHGEWLDVRLSHTICSDVPNASFTHSGWSCGPNSLLANMTFRRWDRALNRPMIAGIKCFVVVPDISGMDDCRQNQPECIQGDTLSLASIDLFAELLARLVGDVVQLNGPTVDDRSTGRTLASMPRRSMSGSVS